LTGFVVFNPRLRLAYDTPQLRAVLETAVTIIGSLVSFLLFGRYRRSRGRDDLAITAALGMLALDYPLFVSLPFVGPEQLEEAFAWVYLTVHACAAALLWWASGHRVSARATLSDGESQEVTPEREAHDYLGKLTPLYPVSALGGGFILFLVVLGQRAQLRGSTVIGTVGLFAQPGISSVRLLSALLLLLATVRFCRANRFGEDRLIGWLSVGCALLAVGDLQYGLYPPLHLELHLGDVFRLAAVLVFAVGAAAEMYDYWHEGRKLARLEERRLVATELHDGLSQELAFLCSYARTSPAPDAAAVWFEQLRAASDRALAESRRAIAALVSDRPLSLTGDLEETVRRIAVSEGVSVHLDLAGGWPDRLDSSEREVLLRIVREAVINAVRHGRPTQITVSADAGGAWPMLMVEDDGTGFDTASIGRGGGFGIISMRERARTIGARLCIQSSCGGGTRVVLSWQPQPATTAEDGLVR
jgi:signal transduction histidine kinase